MSFLQVLEGLRWGERTLLKKEVENPRFDADVLLAEVLELPRESLYLDRERVLSVRELTAYREMIERRAAREPLQYILRRQEFMGLPFYVDKRVLIPRGDSEVLVEKWLEFARAAESAPKVADLCTGSGALAIAMAYFCPEAEIVGTDLSRDALDVARKNALSLAVSVGWRQGDFLAPIRGEVWDYIVTNPPYVSTEEYAQCSAEIFWEPAAALLGGEEGLDFYRRLAAEADRLLRPGGKILMEIGWRQGDPVCNLFQKQGLVTQVFSDLGGRDRVVVAGRAKC